MRTSKLLILFLLFYGTIYCQKINDTIINSNSDTCKFWDRTFQNHLIEKKYFNKGVIFSPLQLVDGRVPGFNFNCINGNDPNPIFDFQIRGISNLMFMPYPLYVVDDIPVTNIDFVSSESIESVELLNSPFQTSEYGFLAFEGVVKE